MSDHDKRECTCGGRPWPWHKKECPALKQDDKLTDEQLDEYREGYGRASDRLLAHIDAQTAELRALRKLREEVKPALRLVADGYPQLTTKARLDEFSQVLASVRNILARHYNKKESNNA